MADIPSPLTWGTVRGNFGALNADSSDPGPVPDLDTVQGSVTLTPRLALVRILNPANPMIAIAKTVTCAITNGVLIGPDGLPDVRVVATDSPGFEPAPLQWDVRINIVGATLQPSPMTINVPGGGVVDLALVIPSPPVAPIITVVSEETKFAAEAAAQVALDAAAQATAPTADMVNFVLSDPSSPASQTVSDQIATQVPPIVADAIAADPTVAAAAAAAVNDALDDTSIPRVIEVIDLDDDAEWAQGDGEGRPSWVRYTSEGMPSQTTKKAIAIATGFYRGPDEPTFFPSGASYTWFQTDPTTGELLDILNGVS